MKHPTPQRVLDWKNCPKLCHTCKHYKDDGMCEVHKSEPPEYFAAIEGACSLWSMDVRDAAHGEDGRSNEEGAHDAPLVATESACYPSAK